MGKHLVFFIGLMTIISCTKVIDIDLNEANSIVVIEANYAAEDSTVRVLVTQTTSYFNNETPPTINNAAITIIDHLGNSTVVPFVSEGKYELTNYIPLYDTEYVLNVSYDGTIYSATSEMRTPIVQMPIYYEYTEGFFGSKAGYLAYLSYLDPVASQDHIMAILSKNGKPKTKLDQLTLADDQLTNGNTIVRPLFAKIFNLGDTVGVELRTIDRDVYHYYIELQSLTDPNSAAPANPTFQWTNKALGYFSAYGNSRQEVVVI
ncbi:MAG: hypothetical protein ACI837_001684 [Crocinitomicaceae bacterium]|jgi:hypothetical protein